MVAARNAVKDSWTWKKFAAGQDLVPFWSCIQPLFMGIPHGVYDFVCSLAKETSTSSACGMTPRGILVCIARKLLMIVCIVALSPVVQVLDGPGLL